MESHPWTPTDNELRAIISRATDRLTFQQPKVDWVPLPWSAADLEPPDDTGFVIAIGTAAPYRVPVVGALTTALRDC
jgi:hypothetical protein